MSYIVSIFKSFLLIIPTIAGKALGLFWSEKIAYFFYQSKQYFFTNLYKSRFKKFGNKSFISSGSIFRCMRFIEIGNNSTIGPRAVITCYQIEEIDRKPQFIIKDNVSIGSDCHITCANNITIENGVLTGKYLLIGDNSHGSATEIFDNIRPQDRAIYSKGSIKIEENVWIGDKVTILPGVRIGKGSIIGSGAVVTKSIPEYSIAVGNPAKTKDQTL